MWFAKAGLQLEFLVADLVWKQTAPERRVYNEWVHDTK